MKYVSYVVLLLALAVSAAGQATNLQSPFPRPYVFGGVDLNSGGYDPLDIHGGVGVRVDSKHFLFNIEGAADNGHKSDSHTGSDKFVQARAFYRFNNGWYVGGGDQWSELKTSLYEKHQWRPTAGVGRDFIGPFFSARLQTLYVFSGTDKLNGVHGVDVSLWIPSPATKAHLFFFEDLDMYRFHQTNLPDQHAFASFLMFGVMYRF